MHPIARWVANKGVRDVVWVYFELKSITVFFLVLYGVSLVPFLL